MYIPAPRLHRPLATRPRGAPPLHFMPATVVSTARPLSTARPRPLHARYPLHCSVFTACPLYPLHARYPQHARIDCTLGICLQLSTAPHDHSMHRWWQATSKRARDVRAHGVRCFHECAAALHARARRPDGDHVARPDPPLPLRPYRITPHACPAAGCGAVPPAAHGPPRRCAVGR